MRKPGPYSGIVLFSPAAGVVLDELDRAAAGEERVHRVGLGRRDLGQQRLELDVRERQRQFLDDLAAALLERLLEAAHRLVAGRVLPGDRHRLLVALLGRHLAHRVGRLPVRERAAEDVRRAHRAGDRVGAGVGHDQQRAAFLRRLGHRHRHARVHGADEHVDLVALDQLVDVVGGLGRVGLVVDLEVLDLAAAELAALFLRRAAGSRSRSPCRAPRRCRVYGSIKPTFSFVCACVPTAASSSPAPSAVVNNDRCMNVSSSDWPRR